VVKFNYHKIITQSDVWVGLFIVTMRKFECGPFRVVLFRRIKILFSTANLKCFLAATPLSPDSGVALRSTKSGKKILS